MEQGVLVIELAVRAGKLKVEAAVTLAPLSVRASRRAKRNE